MKLKNKIGAGLVALLVAGGVGVAVAPAASAHTGDLNVSYTCDTTTGEYVGTAELTISQTGLAGVTNWKVGTTNFEGTPSSDAGLSGALPSTGAGKITLGTFRLPGDTKTKGPWVYAFTTWTDGFKKGSDGQAYQNLAGDCTVPYVPPADAKFDVGITPATCTVGETLSYSEGNFTNATVVAGSTPSGTAGPAAYSVSATPNQGAAFVEGQTNPIAGNLAGPIGNQSTDPAAPCYVAPPEEPEQPEPIVTVVETSDKDCDAKTVTTTVTTTTSNRTVYNEETNTWDPIEDLVEVTSSERPTTAEECPVTVTPTPTPEESSPAPQPSETPEGVLAFTGAPTMAPFLWFAGSAIGLGLIAIIAMAIVQRRKAHTTEQ